MTPLPVKYDINTATGEIRRIQGEENRLIATLNGDEPVYVDDDARKYDSVVRRRINEAKRLPVAPINPATFAQPQVAPETETVIAGPSITISSQGPQMSGLNVDQRKAVVYLRRQEGFPDEIESPEPPLPKKGAFGDKNPEFVTHLLRYQPEEFVRRYGVSGMGEVQATRTVIDNTTSRRKIEKFMQKGVISRRKTQYTLIDPARLGVKDE